jgi:hypothetical protein
MNKCRTTILAAGIFLCVLSLTVAVFAADSQPGTWKLNIAKSKYDPANLAMKSQTSKIEASGGGIKAVVDQVNSDGKAIHYEFNAKYDGKDYAVKGDPSRDTVSYKRVDDFTYETISKKAGKVTTTARYVYTKDGKTRTITTTGTNAEGKKVNNSTVWDKQ